MGGAGRASTDGGESAFLNPASTAHIKQYFVSGHYERGEQDNEGDFSRWAVQIADGTTGNLVNGDAHYYKQKIDLPGGAGARVDQDIQLGASAFASTHVSVGVAGHYLMQSGQGRDNAQLNANLGVIYAPFDYLGFGAVAYDIAGGGSDVLPDRRLIPTYAIGAQFVPVDLLRLRLDIVRPDVQAFKDYRANVMMGLESFFADSFAFRLGCQWLETANQTNVTAGLGYVGPRLQVDYTFEKDIRSAGGVRHFIDLWLPL